MNLFILYIGEGQTCGYSVVHVEVISQLSGLNSPLHVGSRNRVKIIRLGNKCLYLVSRLTGFVWDQFYKLNQE